MHGRHALGHARHVPEEGCIPNIVPDDSGGCVHAVTFGVMWGIDRNGEVWIHFKEALVEGPCFDELSVAYRGAESSAFLAGALPSCGMAVIPSLLKLSLSGHMSVSTTPIMTSFP